MTRAEFVPHNRQSMTHNEICVAVMRHKCHICDMGGGADMSTPATYRRDVSMKRRNVDILKGGER